MLNTSASNFEVWIPLYICIWNLSYLAWDLPLKMAAIIQICMIAAFTMKSGIFAHPFDIGLLFDIHILCRFFPEKATTLATDILNELVQVSSVFRLTYLNNSLVRFEWKAHNY